MQLLSYCWLTRYNCSCNGHQQKLCLDILSHLHSPRVFQLFSNAPKHTLCDQNSLEESGNKLILFIILDSSHAHAKASSTSSYHPLILSPITSSSLHLSHSHSHHRAGDCTECNLNHQHHGVSQMGSAHSHQRTNPGVCCAGELHERRQEGNPYHCQCNHGDGHWAVARDRVQYHSISTEQQRIWGWCDHICHHHPK